MTVTLIVLSHPDRRSFNGNWADATEAASKALGHTILWSDLTAMNFDPVEGAKHYPCWPDAGRFDPLKAQEAAANAGDLPTDISVEVDKIRHADRVVFHFPLWWFAPPAQLKGWFDRVFAHGALHTVDERFDLGRCAGKRALFCVTTGAREMESAFNGKEGDVQMLLWPAAYTLRYLGFTVLVPEIVHGVHGYHEGTEIEDLQHRLHSVLNNQRNLMADFDERSVMPFNADDDFDANGTLRIGRPSHTPFIRHDP